MEGLYPLLGVTPGGKIVIQSIQVNSWGYELVFQCLHQSDSGEALPFTLTLTDCREMQWRVYARLAQEGGNQLVQMQLGRDQHRSPARMLTEAFGLVVFYGTLSVVT